ncbi:hypothetical protein C9I98_16540 [Photobacterium sanctipauli]|uniref:Uncharacterized protein n=1 Tax=Photobacterium sanctipauli TaxID=1342794 RepID=A0A2T3NPX3_9GAMM|nr:PD-(D/E)XK nuclease family protein [Photobacterium sanctipauli]PSW18310.1 hypothetical protein C9I98_16540 [Photobacterium sanctipauli]
MLNIFSEIEGLAGEDLSSALLNYLLLNSLEVRTEFISLLSDVSPTGYLSCYRHFSSTTEYTTSHKAFGNGRIDLLLQLDNAVVGIENKFWASFQQNQPEKYLETLKEVSINLKNINNSEVHPLLFILCPASRAVEARGKAKQLENVRVITWQKLISAFKEIDTLSNPLVDMVLREFIRYIDAQFSFLADYRKKHPHFRSNFPDKGSTLQYELLAKIWNFFPNPNSRVGCSNE